jgi:hypothetical protein
MSIVSNHHPEIIDELNDREVPEPGHPCGQAFPDEDWQDYSRWSEELEKQQAEPPTQTTRRQRLRRQRPVVITFTIEGTDYQVYPLAIDPSIGTWMPSGSSASVADSRPTRTASTWKSSRRPAVCGPQPLSPKQINAEERHPPGSLHTRKQRRNYEVVQGQRKGNRPRDGPASRQRKRARGCFSTTRAPSPERVSAMLTIVATRAPVKLLERPRRERAPWGGCASFGTAGLPDPAASCAASAFTRASRESGSPALSPVARSPKSRPSPPRRRPARLAGTVASTPCPGRAACAMRAFTIRPSVRCTRP